MKCLHCGREFVPSRSDARYCSGRCRTAVYRGSPPPSGSTLTFLSLV
jgi:uncharacterized OB-fold protein